jgi:DNA ligase (NAD+)
MDRKEAEKRINNLKDAINYHRYNYHVLDKQEISDEALDSLKHELFLLEQQYPELITSDSPTQRVGGKVLDGFVKVKHAKQMVSLEDIFTQEELFDWQKYLERQNVNPKSYFAELKVDGFAISLIYQNALLKQAITRGDGKIGEDVTENIKTIESIPLKLFIHQEKNISDKVKNILDNVLKNGQIEIRGEVYMSKTEFDRINKERQNKGEEVYANPRNLASGSIRQLDSKVASSRKLSFMAYELPTDVGAQTHEEKHLILEALGFKTDFGKSFNNLSEVQDFWKEVENKKEKYDFLIDGVVVTVNDNNLVESLGIVGKTPRGARALKFSPNQATTIVEDIVVQIGRTGTATPVACLKPIMLGGVKVARATLHNMDQIEKLDIKIGDTVVVARAGDVIPAIVSVVKQMRDGSQKTFKMPDFCPVCGKKLQRQGDDVAYRCINPECPAVHREKLYHFVSKKAFDIDGLGPEIIDALLDNGVIKNASDIFKIKISDLENLERFAQKSSQNLVDAIADSKKISLEKFIYALGIRHVGEETSMDLARHFKNIKNLINASADDLKNLKDIGPKSSEAIREWFLTDSNIDLISKLLENGITIINPKPVLEKLANKNFVITGTLPTLSRDQAKDLIVSMGGKVASAVSKNTDYLVLGENAGSKLDEANKFGVKIIDEKQLKELVEK